MDLGSLHLFILADLHLGSTRHTTASFHHALVNMRRLDPAAAVVVAGDITDWGAPEQFQDAWSALEKVPVDQLIVCLGNHDVRGPHTLDWNNDQESDPTYFRDVVLPEYQAHYLSRLPGAVAWQPYFTVDLGDYHFIVMNSEKGLKDAAYISAQQIAWLDEQLQAGEDEGQKNLVLVHQALRDTHWRSNIGGGFGIQDAVVKDVLRRHPNTFILSGHLHNGFGVAEAIPRSFGTCIDLPAFALSVNGYVGAALGYYCTFSARTMKFAAWDFAINRPLPQYDLLLSTTTLAAALPGLAKKDPEAASRALQLLHRSYSSATVDDPRQAEVPAAPAEKLFGAAVQTQITDLIGSVRPRRALDQDLNLKPYHAYFARRDDSVEAISRLSQNLLMGSASDAAIEARLTRQFVQARLAQVAPQFARFSDDQLRSLAEEAQRLLVGVFPRVDRTALEQALAAHAQAQDAQTRLVAAEARYLLKDPAATQPTIDAMVARLDKLPVD
ncbi:metallophosphoesterase family protein [Lacticaseibacillus jixianensis]|uniref:Metallophosphoesterase family protein n=1 Tax=Lacticaseibacillus jixianensis TaxID=2486012 RepID=A0ABW4B6D8_9LACO|nr:metallophosphoesterase [Lacticaseibacillus jixianensis]